MTISAFAAPELTSGSEHPHLNRPAFAASPAMAGVRQNATAAGVLVGMPGGVPNARRPVAIGVVWCGDRLGIRLPMAHRLTG